MVALYSIVLGDIFFSCWSPYCCECVKLELADLHNALWCSGFQSWHLNDGSSCYRFIRSHSPALFLKSCLVIKKIVPISYNNWLVLNLRIKTNIEGLAISSWPDGPEGHKLVVKASMLGLTSILPVFIPKIV